MEVGKGATVVGTPMVGVAVTPSPIEITVDTVVEVVGSSMRSPVDVTTNVTSLQLSSTIPLK